MANDNTKNPNQKQPGEHPDGKFHFNPGNMAGKKPEDTKQTKENRSEPHAPEEKTRRLGAAIAGIVEAAATEIGNRPGPRRSAVTGRAYSIPRARIRIGASAS